MEKSATVPYCPQTTISHPRGLAATVYPKYFNAAVFGSLINCFTFLTGFDDTFMECLGVEAIRPKDLGWTNLETKKEWISAVNEYFMPHLPEPNPASTNNRFGTYDFNWTPTVPALCFPLIKGATDYHWAVYNGTYWLEQAGHGGAINLWASLDGLLEAVYKRGDGDGKFYVEGSHFFFKKNI